MSNEEIYNIIQRVAENCKKQKECEGCPLLDENDEGYYACLWRRLMFELNCEPHEINLNFVKEIINT